MPFLVGIPRTLSTRVMWSFLVQAEAAAKYGEELRTEAQQASSFIYHLKRFNNWVKATVRVYIALTQRVFGSIIQVLISPPDL